VTGRAVAAMLMLVVFSACGGALRETPHELLGRWNSSHPSYRDRVLHFEPRVLTLGTGKDEGHSFAIKSIELVDEEDTTHRVRYADVEGNEYTLSFVYEPTDEQIVFSNQKGLVWTRE